MVKKRIRQVCFLLFWLLLWQASALFIDNNILLVGPFKVLSSLFTQIGTVSFWQTCFVSLSRICLGFLSAFCIAVFSGAVSYRFLFFRELLTPVMLFAKSVPVASFVILALIIIGSKNLSVLIAFVVVLPIIYASTLSGLKSTDLKLLEMSAVFRLTWLKKVKAVYLPALLPYLMSGTSSAFGMGVKSGVAAEVIGIPDFSIGERLYTAKLYLDTADLLVWTLVVILVTWLFEKIFLYLLSKLCPKQAAIFLVKQKSGSREQAADSRN